MKTEQASRYLRLCAFVFVTLFTQTSFHAHVFAQPPSSASPLGNNRSSLVIRSFAISGTPYGVAKIELPLRVPVSPGLLGPIDVFDDEGRVFFPATTDVLATLEEFPTPAGPALGEPRIGGGRLLRRVGELVRQATTDPDEPQVVTREVIFLFRGDQPLTVRTSVMDDQNRSEFQLVPASPIVPQDYSTALNLWWKAFTNNMQSQADAGDYPTVIEDYLVAWLAGRLDLPLPPEYVTNSSFDNPDVASTLQLIAGTEKIRGPIFRRAAMGMDQLSEPASLPLPQEPKWQLDAATEPIENEIAIEPLAEHVPPECFYIRYGSFENYLWFNDLSAEYGGDIGRMIALRGSDIGATLRIENQLNLKMTAMSRMLGSSVIDDQAIVGRDLFLSEGPSLGVMFRAKNAFLLQTSLNADRTAIANADEEVVLSNERILDRDVSFLRTPDNRIRSFMIVDGDTVFVTNSRTLARRFIEVGQTKQSLGSSVEFRLARQLMPLDRGDTIFAYFSPAMMRDLVTPSYLIELRRRLFATADMSLVQLAGAAAKAEGNLASGPEELVEEGYLPREFLSRADGSGLITVGDTVIDSMRGKAGTFLPIADIEIDRVTQEEFDWYSRIAESYETRWPQLDPIFVGVRRSDVPESPGMQRLEVHAEIAPFEPTKYGDIAKQLGPPTNIKIDFAPDDIVAGQAHVVSDQLGGTIPPHHLFAAVKDTDLPLPTQLDGFLKTYRALRELPGYLGAWPQPGLLDRLPLGLGRGQPVGPGMTRLIGGVYRFQGNDFSILSFQSDVLAATLPYLVASESETAAQVRLRVGNLRESKLEGWINEQLYQQSIIKSRAGAELLALVSRHLKIPAEDADIAIAKLIGSPLQDPLGGSYSRFNVRQHSSSTTPEREMWVSDSWLLPQQGSEAARELASLNEPPQGYTAPVLGWFRGGYAELTQYDDRIVVDANFDVQRTRLLPTRRAQASSN